MNTQLRFTSPLDREPGLLASMLRRSYASVLESDPKHWGPIAPTWEEFDREVFARPTTVGASVFLSWLRDELVGFGSYDLRPKPEFARIGHNCILPEFRGRGFGEQQILEILRRFRATGIRRAAVTTCAEEAFLPAQRMYIACGFHKTGRVPSGADPTRKVIEYERDLD